MFTIVKSTEQTYTLSSFVYRIRRASKARGQVSTSTLTLKKKQKMKITNAQKETQVYSYKVVALSHRKCK